VSRNEVSIEEVDQILDQVKELQKNRPDLSAHLNSMRRNLLRMRVALSELEELRDEHSRGDLTEDTYLTRRKKLKMDFMSAKDNISDETLNELLEQVEDKEEKSRLTKIKNVIMSNKDLISFLFQILSTILTKK
jgi:flagellar biosynthesis component FlhA